MLASNASASASRKVAAAEISLSATKAKTVGAMASGTAATVLNTKATTANSAAKAVNAKMNIDQAAAVASATGAMGVQSGAMGKLGGAFQLLKTPIAGVGIAAAAAVGAAAGFITVLGDIQGVTVSLNKDVLNAANSINQLASSFSTSQSIVTGTAKQASDLAKSAREASEEALSFGERSALIRAGVIDVNEGLGLWGNSIEVLKSPLRGIANAYNDITGKTERILENRESENALLEKSQQAAINAAEAETERLAKEEASLAKEEARNSALQSINQTRQIEYDLMDELDSTRAASEDKQLQFLSQKNQMIEMGFTKEAAELQRLAELEQERSRRRIEEIKKQRNEESKRLKEQEEAKQKQEEDKVQNELITAMKELASTMKDTFSNNAKMMNDNNKIMQEFSNRFTNLSPHLQAVSQYLQGVRT